MRFWKTLLVMLAVSACGVGIRIEDVPPTSNAILEPASPFLNHAIGLNSTPYELFSDGSALLLGGFFLSNGNIAAPRSISGAVSTELLSQFSTFNLTATNRAVVAFVTAQDGSGDTFVSVLSTVLRLNAQGTPVAGFTAPAFNGDRKIFALTVDSLNRLYIGGGFTQYNGTTNINSIARANADGSLDTTFDIGSGAGAGFGDEIYDLTLSTDGSEDLYVGGSFVFYNNTTDVNRIVRLNSNGSIDTGFNIGSGATAGFDGPVFDLEVIGSGDLYVAGKFTQYNGTTGLNSLVRLNNDGSLDVGFNTGSTTSGFNADVHAIALADDDTGDIYAGGDFSSYMGTAVGYIARLDSTGALVTSFSTTGFNAPVRALLSSDDGRGGVLAAGEFTQFNGLSNVQYLAYLSADGDLRNNFLGNRAITDGFNGSVLAFASDNSAKGTLYAGGNFSTYNLFGPRNGLVRLKANAAYDYTFKTGTGNSAGFDGWVEAIAVTTAGIYVGGNFEHYQGSESARGIVRLLANGNVDTSFNTGSGANAGFDNRVTSIVPATDGSGDIYVGGLFGSYRGTPNVARIARLNSDGSLDTAFQTGSGATAGFDNAVLAISQATDGSGDVYVGGDFTSYNGSSNINRIIRLNSDGSLDSGFNIGSGASAGFNAAVKSIAVATDGSGDIYIVGAFTNYNSATNINRVVRLNSDGTQDLAFNIGSGATAGFDSWANAALIAGDGSGDLYVAGAFTTYNGATSINRIVRLNSDGTVDGGFSIGSGVNAGFDSEVFALAWTDANLTLLVGGAFTSYAGVTHRGIAYLNSSGASQ